MGRVIIQTTNDKETEQRETIQCPNCRTICDALLNFCGRCGQRLRGATPALRTVPLTPSAPHTPLPMPRQSISSGFLVMLGICILSILFAVGTGIFAFTRPSGSHTVPRVSATPSVPKMEGVAWFYPVRGQDDGVALHLNALPKLANGTVYVGWLINPYRPDQILAVGPIVPDLSGQALFQSDRLSSFNAQVQDLRPIFTQVAVTIEKVGGPWLRPTRSPLLQGTIDVKTLTAITPLFMSSPYTPKKIALVSGLHTQTREIARWFANMLDAQRLNQTGNVHVDLLRIIYLLEGVHGADVARLKITSQQSITSAGDGIGLLSMGTKCQQDTRMCGYLDMIRTTVQALIAQHLVSYDATQKVLTTLATIRQLAQSISQLAANLVTLSKLDTPTLHTLTALETQIDALLNGRDTDGDGSIDPVPGEATSAQLYVYIQQLGTIRLM